MTSLSRRRRLAQALILPLLIAATAACSSGASRSPTAAPTTGSGTGSSTTTGAQACHAATSGTGSTAGGDVAVPGDIPDTQHFVTFHSSDGYRLDYPEGWAQAQSGSTVTFTDKFNSVRADSTAAPSAPTVASAQTSDVPTLAASAPCFQAATVTDVARKAGHAILITYRSESPPDAVTGKIILLDVERYQFWASGKLVTLTLSSPKGSDNVDPWRRVTDSFAWGP